MAIPQQHGQWIVRIHVLTGRAATKAVRPHVDAAIRYKPYYVVLKPGQVADQVLNLLPGLLIPQAA